MPDKPRSPSPAAGAASSFAPAHGLLVVPRSTYRFQFHKDFTLNQAMALVQYLDRLGIGGCYASPVFTARAGSLHGYDVVRHDQINPEIGTEADFEHFAGALSDREMAFVIDVVPNHMCITSPENRWWSDVLENGLSSPFSKYFDILWNPPKQDLQNKVSLPFLGDQYGRILESGDLQLAFEDGRFLCRYYESRFPIAPRSWALILEPVLRKLRAALGGNHEAVMELESIVTAINHLPLRTETEPDRVRERYREKDIASRRIVALAENSEQFRHALDATIREINGRKGDPRSFDRLETILEDQTYRLCFWRVAADEINYRRFFDISDLAAIRVEEPEVFDAVHGLALKMVARGWVTGLRIDHVDGLYDPRQYLEDLQQKCAAALAHSPAKSGNRFLSRFFRPKNESFYVVVEKILVGDERLRDEWATNGTTGYDFMNDLNGLFVHPTARRRFPELYARFVGRKVSYPDVLATCKKFIMLVGLASELRVLTTYLDRISEQHRWSRDFTEESLRFALREVIAYFPAYRSYIRSDGRVSDADRRVIDVAIESAKRHNPATDRSLFDFVRSVLMLEHPDGLALDQIRAREQFVMRFQQLTSPVMAKGAEDTAFYRYFPLASLNEVGGEPDSFGLTPKQFHMKNMERQSKWPSALSATTTHDTKRSEDVRARINVLSEMPVRWYRAIRRWEAWNKHRKTILDGRPAPDANEEYLFYQTVAGSWPAEPMDAAAREAYVGRIEAYLLKAVKEAKVHTSWISPNAAYEKAVASFVRSALEPGDNRFLTELIDLQKAILVPGLLNSLSQTLIKAASPGVPDFYQGTEMWDFSLVDPDNRRPVDYERRMNALRAIEQGESHRENLCDELMRRVRDGDVKLYIIKQALDLRRREDRLFQSGSYVPLTVDGPRKNNVVAFARTLGPKVAIAAATRFFLDLTLDDNNRVTNESLHGTGISLKGDLASARYRDVYTGREISPVRQGDRVILPASDLFRFLPVAFLEKVT